MTNTYMDRIKEVLVNNDTNKDIYDKIVDKYPELLDGKVQQFDGDEKRATQQVKVQITERINHYEGVLFEIDRTERPFRYSFIDHNADEIDDDDDIIISDTVTEEEIDTGYIYILDTNLYTKEGKSIYKIGKANDIDKRIKQLNSEQGCYQKHILKHSYHVERPYKIEHSIHCVLDKGRVNPKKEGFYSDCVEENIGLIETMIEIFKINDQPKGL